MQGTPETPEAGFESARRQHGSDLPFSYQWRLRSNNESIERGKVDALKQKLGWYARFYDDEPDYNFGYPPYQLLERAVNRYYHDIRHIRRMSILEKCVPAGDNYVLPKRTLLFKGTKYFYTPETEAQFKDVHLSYFGERYVAFFYAKRYSGGIQVYRAKRDLKLFNVTNTSNIAGLQRRIDGRQGQLCEGISYGEFRKALSVKYGVGINRYKQAHEIAKYNRWDSLWLYRPQPDVAYRNTARYDGWYYGSGFIDRVVATGLMHLLRDRFDGLVGEHSYYTPYLSHTNTEIVLFSALSVLQRRPKHPLDTMRLMPHLPFDPRKLRFDERHAMKNKNLRMVRFYVDHPLRDSYDLPPGLRVMSLNVHNFRSVNLDDTRDFIMRQLLRLLRLTDTSVLCCQEFYNQDLQLPPQDAGDFAMLRSRGHEGLVILHRRTVPVRVERVVKLPNDVGLDPKRFGLFFRVAGRTLCSTHLEIGKRFFERSGSVMQPEQLLEIVSYNTGLRKRQLDALLLHRPDYIIGDLNFTPQDAEFDYITAKGYESERLPYTTPFDTQVDYMFGRLGNKPALRAVSFPYSDHLPVVGVISPA